MAMQAVNTVTDINKIRCPNCRREFRLTEAMTAQITESAAAEFEQRLEAERVKAQTEARQTARAEAEKVKAEAEREAAGLRSALHASKAEQARLLAKERDLDQAKADMDLTIQRQINAQVAQIKLQASRDAESSIGLKLAEKDEALAGLTKQIEELKRRAEQGSQQSQGEAQEIVLELLLREEFALDAIEPVAKGVSGADCIQRVSSRTGKVAGTLIWESKRTKTWSDQWLSKLRDDQRAAKADVAILVTQAMPKGTSTFDLIDGVWVVEWKYALPVATMIRQMVTEVAAVKLTREGQASKAELMYDYLTGTQFKARVQAVVERVKEMSEDLEKERTALTRIWAKREGQIKGTVSAMAGMYGDLQSIAGRAIGEAEMLGLPQ